MSGKLRQMAVATTFMATALAAAVANGQTSSWRASVDSALGRTGTLQPDSTYKFGFPRSDLAVTIGTVSLRPALALGSWIAFLPVGGSESIVMGDLVLTEGEIASVMRVLQAGGVEQTALHNHLRGETPHVMYVHIMARGKPVTIARTIRTALAKTGTPPAPAGPMPVAGAIDLDTVGIARIIGRSGKINGGVYQISVARAEVIREGGIVIPPSMGVATAINIQPAGGGRAVATGDFVLRSTEVNRVIRALRDHAIEVTALHSHMIDESPRLFFMHFWADGDALTVARGLRSALDITNSQRVK
jgi:uncharacterized protein DUF1259